MEKEKRLIDANALLGRFRFTIDANDTVAEVIAQCVKLAVILIKEAPTVDAVEVVHGHWCWEGRFRACSECGSYVEFTETLGASHWKYCPYCGAKMDADATEQPEV